MQRKGRSDLFSAFVVRKETKHCRIFAKQMYGQVTCVVGYRRFHPNVICHASKMHDADSVHRRRRLCMDRGSSRENQRVRSTSDSEAGRIFESGEERNQALSYICEANVRPSNLRSRLQKVSPERNMSCIKDA